MAEPFLTTVVGSLPNPAWLLEQISMNAAAGNHVHRQGADRILNAASLKAAHDDAVRRELFLRTGIGDQDSD